MAISFRLSILFSFKASSTEKSFKYVSSGSFTNWPDAKKRLDFLTALGLLFLSWVANGVPSRLDISQFSYSYCAITDSSSGLSYVICWLFYTHSRLCNWLQYSSYLRRFVNYGTDEFNVPILTRSRRDFILVVSLLLTKQHNPLPRVSITLPVSPPWSSCPSSIYH
jgi:hypothetical protein